MVRFIKINNEVWDRRKAVLFVLKAMLVFTNGMCYNQVSERDNGINGGGFYDI